MLTNSQKKAIENVSNYVIANKEHYLEVSNMILYQANIDKKLFESFQENIKKHARIALHFHPDRETQNGKTVTQGLIEMGQYKNQFETNLSAGSLSANEAGGRNKWESELFMGALDQAKPSERPKYGSLNLTLPEGGSSPRFGSCYFMLKPKVKERATFSYGDSHQSPKEIGTINQFELITSALLNDLFTRETALGEQNLGVYNFLSLANTLLPHSTDFSKYKGFSRNLDFYIEAQVHGEILLSEDVDMLVADYSFSGTAIGNQLEVLCSTFGIKLNWNSGLALVAKDFPINFRGKEVPAYAEKISKEGVVNASVIGQAAQQVDKTAQELQMLKYLWHCLVRFGKCIK